MFNESNHIQDYEILKKVSLIKKKKKTVKYYKLFDIIRCKLNTT